MSYIFFLNNNNERNVSCLATAPLSTVKLELELELDSLVHKLCILELKNKIKFWHSIKFTRFS